VTEPNDIPTAQGVDNRTEPNEEIVSREAETGQLPTEVMDDIVSHRNRRSARRRLGEAAIWSALLFVVIGGSVLTLVNALKQPPRTPSDPSLNSPIDGTYRVDLYREAGSTRIPSATLKDGIAGTEWWAFQSVCSAQSCTAIGTRLDDTIHTQIATAPSKQKLESLRLINGQWISDPPSRVPHACAAGTPGHDTWRVSIQLAKLADGTFKGQESDLIESNECGRAGTVVTTPIVATRNGDLPTGLPPMTPR
jgi:serine/threonine protein kinase, bacterial